MFPLLPGTFVVERLRIVHSENHIPSLLLRSAYSRFVQATNSDNAEGGATALPVAHDSYAVKVIAGLPHVGLLKIQMYKN